MNRDMKQNEAKLERHLVSRSRGSDIAHAQHCLGYVENTGTNSAANTVSSSGDMLTRLV